MTVTGQDLDVTAEWGHSGSGDTVRHVRPGSGRGCPTMNVMS